MRFFVNPHYPRDFLREFFHHLVRLIFRVGLEIKNQDILTAKAFAARIHKLAAAKEDFDSGIIFVLFIVVLSFLLGLLFFGLFFGLVLLVVLDALSNPLVFFFLLFFVERFVILLH